CSAITLLSDSAAFRTSSSSDTTTISLTGHLNLYRAESLALAHASMISQTVSMLASSSLSTTPGLAQSSMCMLSVESGSAPLTRFWYMSSDMWGATGARVKVRVFSTL